MALKEKKKWLLLIHQIPPKPNALRVKIWRRLHQVGAVAIKPSVYAMPLSLHSQEDLSWILKEIMDGRGDGSILEARFVEGLVDEQIIGLFQQARKADYEKIIQEASLMLSDRSSFEGEIQAPSVKPSTSLTRLQSRLDEIMAIDFFQAPEQGTADILLKELTTLVSGHKPLAENNLNTIENLKSRTWVTRENIFVDRMACGWLIRRFIDEEAGFKFTADTPYIPRKGELRFDMFDGEYTHEGDKCTFEVMIERLNLSDKALLPMAQVVHDIDLKDTKFDRSETDGFKAVLTGLVASQPQDKLRMEQGFILYENLYAYFHRQKS